jgi:hypothetical protein
LPIRSKSKQEATFKKQDVASKDNNDIDDDNDVVFTKTEKETTTEKADIDLDDLLKSL